MERGVITCAKCDAEMEIIITAAGRIGMVCPNQHNHEQKAQVGADEWEDEYEAKMNF